MKPFYRGSEFAGGPGLPSGAGVRGGQGPRTSALSSPALASGPNMSSSGVVRCERGAPVRDVPLTAAVGALLPEGVTPGVVVTERLAHISDEGSNGANAKELNELVSGQFQGTTLEELTQAVKAAEERAHAARELRSHEERGK